MQLWGLVQLRQLAGRSPAPDIQAELTEEDTLAEEDIPAGEDNFAEEDIPVREGSLAEEDIPAAGHMAAEDILAEQGRKVPRRWEGVHIPGGVALGGLAAGSLLLQLPFFKLN